MSLQKLYLICQKFFCFYCSILHSSFIKISIVTIKIQIVEKIIKTAETMSITAFYIHVSRRCKCFSTFYFSHLFFMSSLIHQRFLRFHSYLHSSPNEIRKIYDYRYFAYSLLTKVSKFLFSTRVTRAEISGRFKCAAERKVFAFSVNLSRFISSLKIEEQSVSNAKQ